MRFYRDGRPIQMTCKTESKEIAKAKLRAEMRKTDAEFVEPKYKRVSIGDLVNDLLTDYAANGKRKFYRACKLQWETHLSQHFAEIKAVLFSTDDQRKYRALRVSEGAANATINRELQLIRRAFKIGLNSDPPKVKRVPKFLITREDNARKIFMEPEDVDRLRVAAANQSLGLRVAVELAYWFGWRRGRDTRPEGKRRSPGR